jgi:hypothetical protein
MVIHLIEEIQLLLLHEKFQVLIHENIKLMQILIEEVLVEELLIRIEN